ncbi:MAG: hypothetical protein ACREXQ_05775 [Polaromonas sp.]
MAALAGLSETRFDEPNLVLRGALAAREHERPAVRLEHGEQVLRSSSDPRMYAGQVNQK